MGQAFLRYGQIRNTLDYDIVLLMFVPAEDLWRDINTLRSLEVMDLSEDLMRVPMDQLDRGYDGTHYGPKANKLIAESIKKYLDHL